MLPPSRLYVLGGRKFRVPLSADLVGLSADASLSPFQLMFAYPVFGCALLKLGRRYSLSRQRASQPVVNFVGLARPIALLPVLMLRCDDFPDCPIIWA